MQRKAKIPVPSLQKQSERELFTYYRLFFSTGLAKQVRESQFRRKKTSDMEYRIGNGMQAACLECGCEIYGRSDKKFCSEHCKNSFNNRKRTEVDKEYRKTIKALENNRRILEGLLLSGVKSIDIDRIVELGFDIKHMTGHRKTETGHNEYDCFDIRYCQTGRKIFRIRKTTTPRR